MKERAKREARKKQGGAHVDRVVRMQMPCGFERPSARVRITDARRGTNRFMNLQGAGGMPEMLAMQETCAVRQSTFSKVHENFVTAKRCSTFAQKRIANAILAGVAR
ncbi:hypothetical protein [Herbaspirillum sp. SJZ099]|uniref:hypothetical protein n=1 Tax=Herbaspirillum sp. SJZ099 TaxID=2572916 RepID=UPI0011AAD385|nr:hypothetical protein [Herbaspirillum sp. SJZ099]